MQTYGAYRQAFADRPLPAAFVDRAALESNIETVRQRAGDVPVRVASKSIRCRAILERVLEEPGFAGVMCYTGDEAVHLARHGFEDLLVAYPVVDNHELRAVAAAVADGAEITLMVDCREHVERAAAAASEAGADLPLCIDLDMSTEHAGVYFGVRRSRLRTPAELLGVASIVAEHDGVHLRGLMGYEAQLAGLPDRSPGRNGLENAAIRLLKERSKPRVRERRQRAAQALDSEYDLAFVNGGGTGSVEFTVEDPWVTEVTVGSGFYAPRQFDWYDAFSLEPAAGYAIEVTREPAPGYYTCRGGGYVASGPVGADKAPAVHLPTEASLLANEGAGEVQTPVRYDGELTIGDPVVMRHSKAGELCRTFRELLVVEDDRVVATHPTYRGDGECYI